MAMVQPQLHFFFFPFMGQGHILPSLDMAKVFASRGVKATMVTTHYFAPMFQKAIGKSHDISIRAFKFPAVEAGLPEGTESLDQVSDDSFPNFFKATAMLQRPLETLLRECRPHCLVSDVFFTWTTDLADKFGIPRLLFHGSSTFGMCASDSLHRHRPYDNVSSDSETFVVPDLPHEIKLTRGKISIFERQSQSQEETESEMNKFVRDIRDSDRRSYGVVVNSFYGLESDYIEYYTKNMGRKAWHVGPFLLCNKDVEDKAGRGGKESAIDQRECLRWLDSKKPNSVVYICFGSMSKFTAAQLHEIAKGLEASGQQFIWVVRKCVDEEDAEKWFPKGFEDRMEGRGLIIKGWAPQLLILEHEATGAFVTHCGWNSTLEGVCSGVPMVTWPLFAEQFLNEKLLTDVQKIGVGVGAQRWGRVTTEVVKAEALTKALERIMAGDEALEIRARSKALKELARKAIEEGGSSYSDFNALIRELSEYHSARTEQGKSSFGSKNYAAVQECGSALNLSKVVL